MIAFENLLSAKLVERATSLHIRSIDRLVAANKFPKPVAISDYRRAWKASEVKAWIEQRPADNGAHKMRRRMAGL
jgi:predicted DNA-binding transcriptional regulator AlpA